MYGDEPLGPPRVWLRDLNVPGLCMTRSFGDAVAATVGVLDTPEVLTYPLTREDRWVWVGCVRGWLWAMDSRSCGWVESRDVEVEGRGFMTFSSPSPSLPRFQTDTSKTRTAGFKGTSF